jgi:hypothetical protein
LVDQLVADTVPGGRGIAAWLALLRAHATLDRQLAVDLVEQTGLTLSLSRKSGLRSGGRPMLRRTSSGWVPSREETWAPDAAGASRGIHAAASGRQVSPPRPRAAPLRPPVRPRGERPVLPPLPAARTRRRRGRPAQIPRIGGRKVTRLGPSITKVMTGFPSQGGIMNTEAPMPKSAPTRSQP